MYIWNRDYIYSYALFLQWGVYFNVLPRSLAFHVWLIRLYEIYLYNCDVSSYHPYITILAYLFNIVKLLVITVSNTLDNKFIIWYIYIMLDNENIENEIKYKSLAKKKITEFANIGEKQKFKKSLILGYLSKGSSKKAASEMSGVTEQTFYNWCKDDLEFKAMADACLGGEDELIALTNVSRAVRKGDMEATKYLLNKRRYYEKRFDSKFQDDKVKELEKNPITGVFEPMADDVVSGLLGDGFELDNTDGVDELEAALYKQEEDYNSRMDNGKV